MENNTHKNIKILLLALICGILAYINATSQIKINELTKTSDEAVKETWRKCQERREIEVPMSFVNGCYHAVLNMCSGRYKCMEKYNKVCNVDG